MRNLILALFFIGITVYGTKVFLDNFAYSGNGFLRKSYDYPDAIEITNQEGTEIPITLLGRSSKYLEFENKDGREFVYPIHSLSEESQRLVMKYPENGIKNVALHLSSGNMELNDVHLMQLKDQVRKIRDKIGQLSAKADITQSETEKRTYERDIERLQEEAALIEEKIFNRQ